MAFISNKKQLLRNIAAEINDNYVSHGKPTFFRYMEFMSIVFFSIIFNSLQKFEILLKLFNISEIYTPSLTMICEYTYEILRE